VAVPDFQSLMLPLMQLTNDGQVHTTWEVIDRLSRQFELTTEDLEELLPSGKQRRFVNRVNWATTHLRKAGLLESAGYGKFRLTERGRAVLVTPPPKVDMKFLAQFPGYLEFTGGSAQPGQKAAPIQSVADQTPEERIEATHRELESALEEELLERVLAVSPTYFEQLVVDLLVKMGYGGSGEAAERIGKSGDGGIDGTIYQDPLGLDIVYIQAKRWTGSVSRPTVQGFAGSLEGFKATKGVLITTSMFTAEARGYVDQIAKRIVLVDGRSLAKLMIKHQLGVTPTAIYTLQKVDASYFEAGLAT
jgi:restriction system protein